MKRHASPAHKHCSSVSSGEQQEGAIGKEEADQRAQLQGKEPPARVYAAAHSPSLITPRPRSPPAPVLTETRQRQQQRRENTVVMAR